jgi:signal peptidase I
VIVGLAVGLALVIQAFVVKPYQIPSESMEPTLDRGERVLVNRFLFHFREPGVGDVVVFNPPKGADSDRCGVHRAPSEPCREPTPEKSDTTFIKRIVAGPGDRLEIQDGQPVVNGEPAEEDFINPCGGGGACDLRKAIDIPPDHYFMMGDNRGASQDSRFWGPVPREWIIGQAFGTYWPPQKIGPL